MKTPYPPGFWGDPDGTIHVSLPVLMASMGLDDTPSNRAAVTKMLEEQIRQQVPDATIDHAE